MKNWIIIFIAMLQCAPVFLSCSEYGGEQSFTSKPTTQTTLPDTCDDPEKNIRCCFAQMPDQLTSVMKIAPAGEPGERMIIRGKITKSDGKTPVSDAIIYCYHTNERGIYAKKGGETGVHRWHGHLHGWCRTDEEGRYEIQTIRPARYPSNNTPAHIHPILWVEGREPFYLTDFVFSDDPLIDEKYLRYTRNYPGGTGVVDLKRNKAGIWEGERVIVIN
ncbi:MAG: hypothetical protein Q7T20_01245 [Saprospiraceae bacterium]|nr:hypothetical protein [Saprospiraceae bacterium]